MPDTQRDLPTYAPARAPFNFKRAALAAVVGVVLVAAVIYSYEWWTVGRFIESTNNAYLQADAVVISPKVSGYVTDVLVGDNEVVAGGKALVRIDPAPYQAARDMAEAEIAQREADLVRFKADVNRQKAARVEAAAAVRVAESAARFAADDAVRFQSMAATGAATVQRRDQALAARDQTAGQLAAAHAALEGADRQIDSLTAQIGQGEAALRAAHAKARSTDSDLQGTAIATPIAGRVGDRTVRIGQFVQPGTRLMTVVPDDVYLVANFKETQLARIRPGQKVRMTIDAMPDAKIAGVVESMAPGTGAQFALLPPENATGNFTKIVQRVPVRVRLDVDALTRARLRPGLSVEIDVDTKSLPAQ